MPHYFAFAALAALLGVTFAGLGFGSLALYALVLARAGGPLRRPARVRRCPGRL